MEITDESTDVKQRHGCVTAWLVFMIVMNSLSALIYLFAGDFIAENLPSNIPDSTLIILGVICSVNVIFSFLLLKWKKWGFWGFTATGFVTFAINYNLNLGIAQSLLGLAGVLILFAVLQIKKGEKSAWITLE